MKIDKLLHGIFHIAHYYLLFLVSTSYHVSSVQSNTDRGHYLLQGWAAWPCGFSSANRVRQKWNVKVSSLVFFQKSKSFNFSENFWFLLWQICLSLLFQEEWVIHEPDLKQTCILEAKSNEAQHSSVEPQPSRGMGKKQMPKFYVSETVIFMQQSVSETPFIIVSEITKMLSSRWFLK